MVDVVEVLDRHISIIHNRLKHERVGERIADYHIGQFEERQEFLRVDAAERTPKHVL